MKKTAVILKDNNPQYIDSQEVQILFKSSADWIKDLLESSDISVGEMDADYILYLNERTPLLTSEIIEEGFLTFIDSGKDAVSFKHDGRGFTWCKNGASPEKAKEIEILNPDLVLEIKTAKEILMANKLAAQLVIDKHIENGVIFYSTDGVLISPDAVIEKGAVILPGSIIKGKSFIGANATIGPNSLISDSSIGEGSVINASQILSSKVGSNVSIGPFTQLRPDSVISDNAHIGDFVEIKNSTIGEGTAVAHLTYVGDSDVGSNVNFGCGVVTVNYDGTSKNRTQIGDYAFIGCNTNLVAPVKVGSCAYTAAGSTITDDVPDGALAVARSRQTNKEGWADKKLEAYVEKKKGIKK